MRSDRACRTLLLASYVLVASIIVNAGVAQLRQLPAAVRLFVGSCAFVLLAVGAIPVNAFRVRRRFSRVVGLLFELSAGLAAVVVLMLAGSEVALLRVPATLAIFAAAFTEELVFRFALPRALFAQLRHPDNRSRSAMIVACVVAQAVFALAHVPWLQGARSMQPADVLRLFDAGLLYTVLVLVAGLWLAAAIHTLLNVDAMLLHDAITVAPSGLSIVATGCLLAAAVCCFGPRVFSESVGWLAPAKSGRQKQ